MRKVMLLLVSLVFMGILAGCGNKVDDETAAVYSGSAEQAIVLMSNGEYGAVVEQFDKRMEEVLSEEQLRQVAEPLLDAAGDYVGIKKRTVSEKDSFYTTVLIAEYTEKNRVFTISYNKDYEIIGLYLK